MTTFIEILIIWRLSENDRFLEITIYKPQDLACD